jgi:hypothetical protein
MAEKPKEETPAAATKAADVGLMERIERTVNEFMDVKLKALDITFDKMIEEKMKAKEIEAESALRKGFGLENDPVIHQSDLISAIRKAQLEASPTEKRSPAAEEKAGPTGNKLNENPLDKMFSPFEGGKPN